TISATAFSGDGSGLSNVSGVGSLAADPAACSANNFVTDIAANGTLTCDQPSSSNLSDGASLATKTYADAGDASLAAPQYVTLGVNATLANERVLTAGKGIAITEGGSAVTIDNKVDFAQTSIQGGDTISNFPSGGSEFATTYTIPANTLTAGSVIEIWSAGTLTNGASGNQFGFGVKLGSTVVLPGNLGIFVNASVGPAPWMLTGRIICTSVAGNIATLEAQGFMSEQISSSFSVRNFFNSSTISVDPTVTQELKIYQGVVANDVADTATMRQLIVKILK
ncbi:MAG TPA: hypothetical protein VMZ25_08500, partial [Terriglobales bacterium]|nr:hypothetical protein [Terriglobales bacterium]